MGFIYTDICKINLNFYLELFFNTFEALERDYVKKYLKIFVNLRVSDNFLSSAEPREIIIFLFI